MPKLLFHLLYDWQKKKKKKLFGDPDSLTHLLEPKNIETFHFPWNLKRLPLLKPHLKHSLCLKVCCEVLAIYKKKKKFSISCVKLTIFLHLINTGLCEEPLDCVLWLYACIFMIGPQPMRKWSSMTMWCCRESWLSGLMMGRIYQCQKDTHTHRGITEA